MTLVISLILGMAIGWVLKLNKSILKINSKIQIAILLGLLFSMGMSLGVNPDIVSNLKTIGITSLIFSSLTVFFSIIFVFLFHKFIIKES